MTAVLVATLWLGVGHAHTFEAAYLSLEESEPGVFDVRFKVPTEAEYASPDGLALVLPCEGTPSRVWCEDGLQGTVGIDGLAGLDGVVHIRWADGREQIASIGPDSPTIEVDDQTSSPLPLAYVGLGIRHILLGFDHLMFVLGLMLIVGKDPRRLVGTLTAFTVGHSVTLALAALGLVSLPSAPVEACIALSVVLLAREAVLGEDGLLKRQPWLVAAGFGLLHGLGFAGALRQIGLPEDSVWMALLTFNIGVEVGQILFVAAVWIPVQALREPHRLVVAYGIGGLAAAWTIERVMGLGGAS